MRSLTSILLAASIISIAFCTAGCPERTSIADIEKHPEKYQNKEIAVAGRVTDSYGMSVPGTDIAGGAYKIDDGTGSVWIFVAENSVPTRGAEIGVKGTLGSGVNWKGKNYGLGIYEKDRRYSKH